MFSFPCYTQLRTLRVTFVPFVVVVVSGFPSEGALYFCRDAEGRQSRYEEIYFPKPVMCSRPLYVNVSIETLFLPFRRSSIFPATHPEPCASNSTINANQRQQREPDLARLRRSNAGPHRVFIPRPRHVFVSRARSIGSTPLRHHVIPTGTPRGSHYLYPRVGFSSWVALRNGSS